MRIYNARISTTNPVLSDRARSPTLTFARKFSRFYSNYPANSAIAVSAHTVNVNICRAPSTTKFYNERRH